jgi:hypothetical protein
MNGAGYLLQIGSRQGLNKKASAREAFLQHYVPEWY